MHTKFMLFKSNKYSIMKDENENTCGNLRRIKNVGKRIQKHENERKLIISHSVIDRSAFFLTQWV